MLARDAGWALRQNVGHLGGDIQVADPLEYWSTRQQEVSNRARRVDPL
jgi:hypothetical protein